MNIDDFDIDSYILFLIGSLLVYLAVLILKKKQDGRLNLAMFFSAIWTLVGVYTLDKWFVELGFWNYNGSSMPGQWMFIWVVLWSILPVHVTKASKSLLATIIILSLDLLLMPPLAQHSVLTLSENWWIGELLLIAFIVFPSLMWAHSFYYDKSIWFRNLMQILTFGVLFFFVIPDLTPEIINIKHFRYSGRWSDVFIITVFGSLPWIVPGLLAVKELNDKGQGTAFPYDETKKLVRNGIYAYIRNPIQLSSVLASAAVILYSQHLTLVFVLIGVLVYSVGFADVLERRQLENTFGEDYLKYRSEVRPWWAHWRPKGIAHAEIYFKQDCAYCQSLRKWLERKNTFRLTFRHAHEYEGRELTELTYRDEDGNEYGSVRALAHGIGHVHFLWAMAGWLIRLPGIVHLLQLIVDQMGLNDGAECKIEVK